MDVIDEAYQDGKDDREVNSNGEADPFSPSRTTGHLLGDVLS